MFSIFIAFFIHSYLPKLFFARCIDEVRILGEQGGVGSVITEKFIQTTDMFVCLTVSLIFSGKKCLALL